jgi:hypothetical protein
MSEFRKFKLLCLVDPFSFFGLIYCEHFTWCLSLYFHVNLLIFKWEPKIPEPLEVTHTQDTSGHIPKIYHLITRYIPWSFSVLLFQSVHIQEVSPHTFSKRLFPPSSKLYIQFFAVCSIKLLWHEQTTVAASEVCVSPGDDCVHYWLRNIPNEPCATLCVGYYLLSGKH